MQSTESVDNAIVASWSGVIIAGGLYPIALFVTGWAIAAISSGLDVVSATFIAGIVFGLTVAFLVGCLWAGLVGLASGTITIFFNWSFGGIFSPRSAVIINGGMAGFIATFPVGLNVLSDIGLIGVFFWVTPLAMIMGYVGGLTMSATYCEPCNIQHSKAPRGKYRFRIQDMFVATFWFAVVFAIERLVGDFIFTIWITTGVCLLFALIGIDQIWLWSYKLKTGKSSAHSGSS